MASCLTCVFWSTLTSVEAGYCRRHAPRPSESGSALWPETYKDDWCGDYCCSSQEFRPEDDPTVEEVQALQGAQASARARMCGK